jgi:biotin carboxyl carrier protein
MTLDEIKQLIDLTIQSGIAELEVERSGNRVRIRRTLAQPGSQHHEIVAHAAAAPAAPAVPPVSLAAPHNGGGVEGLVQSAPAAAAPEAGLQLVKAPIVGTFYESPKPGSPLL